MKIRYKVIALLLLSLIEHQAEHDIAHERHYKRGGADVQINSDHLGTAKEVSTSPVN